MTVAAVSFGGLVALAGLCRQSACGAAEIRVDASHKIGTVRAIHGVNGGPSWLGSIVDVSDYERALGIPLSRVHDANWQAREAVDIHSLFPNFTADAESPANYRFAPTDDYLKSIFAVSSNVMYRLGESIEHTPRKYWVHKPADYRQWANICLGVIRHYNEGWGDGLKLNIRYFEIWNEPNLGPEMWDGTSEDYYRLYAAAAKTIKARYPKLLVGGPGATSPGSLRGNSFTPLPFLQGFVEYCKKESAPLDFLSWHLYTVDPSEPARATRGLRRWLDDLGFRNTEIHLDEWNYLPGYDWGPFLSHDPARLRKLFEGVGSLRGAAFDASVLLELQDAPIDMTEFYMVQNGWWGMFDQYGAPKKSYYAFRAFKALVDHPARLAVRGVKAGELSAVAGASADCREVVLVVSNYKSADRRLEIIVNNVPWKGRSEYESFMLNETRDLESLGKQSSDGPAVHITQDLPAPGVLLVYVRKAAK